MLFFCTQSIAAELLPGLKEFDEVNIQANGVNYHSYVRHIQRRGHNVYQLLGNTWNRLVEDVGLAPGTTCVLTKERGNSLWFDAFDDAGSMITEGVFKGAATLRKTQPKPDFFEARKS